MWIGAYLSQTVGGAKRCGMPAWVKRRETRLAKIGSTNSPMLGQGCCGIARCLTSSLSGRPPPFNKRRERQ